MRKLMFAVFVLVLAGAATFMLAPRARAQAAALWPDVTLLRAPGSSIGVTARDLTGSDPARVKDANVTGVVIESVRDDSPAARAGFRPGDVVVEFAGERVRSLRQFARIVRETPPDRTVDASVLRDGSRETLRVQPEAARASLDDLPEFNRRVERSLRNLPRNFSFDWDFDYGPGFTSARGRLGATITPLSDQLADYFGADDGVLVSTVEDDSPASRAGLRAGDVITSINGSRVARPGDLTRAVREAGPGATLEIEVLRDRKEMTLQATMPERERPRAARRGRPV